MPSAKAAKHSGAAHKRLALKEVLGKGRGVFATTPFHKGEEVLEFLGEVRDVKSFGDLTHALQVGPHDFLSSSGDIDDYVNHSCDPNTGIRDVKGRVLLFAMRDIEEGDEISFDYSTTQAGGHWHMDCGCGSPKCRGLIADFKDLPKDLREHYIRSNAVLSFLTAKTSR